MTGGYEVVRRIDRIDAARGRLESGEHARKLAGGQRIGDEPSGAGTRPRPAMAAARALSVALTMMLGFTATGTRPTRHVA
jgi:hypothetical protein